MSQPVNLFHQVTGQGTRPVILLHGLFGMSDNLTMLARALDADYRVHRLDLRNHGRSGRSDTMTQAQMAADVAHYVEQNQLTDYVAVGHSLGGKVAMQMALQHLPGLLGIVVADIAPVSYQPRHDSILEGLNTLDLKAIDSRRDAEEYLAKYVHEPGVASFLLKNLYRNEVREFDWRMNLKAITRCYPSILVAPEGEPSQLPTLFIKGACSDYITAQHESVITQLFPNFRFKIISGTGHWLHAEKPTSFNRLVQQFLEDEISWPV